MHRLGVYWCPGHGRPGDLEYMRQLQPPAIRILDPDVQHISDAHKAAPNALICPRDWALSEQKSDANRDPIATGERHAVEWRDKIDYWRNQAQTRGIPFPQDTQLVIVGINEPNDGVSVNAQVEYTVALCDEARALGLTVSALNLGVGWPGNTGPDTPPNWEPYGQALYAIQRGGHFLTLHEYWYDDPTGGWGWLAGRHTKVPASFTGRILIGECGIDRYVDAERWRNEGGNRGWRGNLDPMEYAEDLIWYADECDSRVAAVLPFLTDYRSREWESFDTQAAHPWLLTLVQDADAEHTIHIPVVLNSGDKPHTESAPVTPDDRWERSYAFVRRWEGGLSLDPEDPGNYYQGQLVGTKYGISAAVWGGMYDIPNLTEQQAEAIYRQHYWQASGADTLPWPLCLFHFDTAVNAGVGQARTILDESGGNPWAYMGHLLDWYTRIPSFERFGKAWVRRRAELLVEAAA